MCSSLVSAEFHLRRFRTAALVLLCFAGLAMPPGIAAATEYQIAYAGLNDGELGETAVSDSELGQERGAGLDSQAHSYPGSANGVAVILWDDYPPPSIPSSAPQSSGTNGRVSVSVGTGTQ